MDWITDAGAVEISTLTAAAHGGRILDSKLLLSSVVMSVRVTPMAGNTWPHRVREPTPRFSPYRTCRACFSNDSMFNALRATNKITFRCQDGLQAFGMRLCLLDRFRSSSTVRNGCAGMGECAESRYAPQAVLPLAGISLRGAGSESRTDDQNPTCPRESPDSA